MRKWLHDAIFGEEPKEVIYRNAERAGQARLKLAKESEYHSEKELAYMRKLQAKIKGKYAPKSKPKAHDWPMLREVI